MSGISFRFMFPGMKDGVDAYADYEADTLALGNEGDQQVFNLGHIRRCLVSPYRVEMPEGGWRESFTPEEKDKLRPVAETLAMLDGNAFFTMDLPDGKEWYEAYLGEASALYEANGGDAGWAGEASFSRREK